MTILNEYIGRSGNWHPLSGSGKIISPRGGADSTAPAPADWQDAWDSNDYDTLRAWYVENTGPSGTLTPSGSVTSTADGEIIENLDVSGTIRVRHDNVTVRNCRVSGHNRHTGHIYVHYVDRDAVNSFTVEDCLIVGDDPIDFDDDGELEAAGQGIAATYASVTIRRCRGTNNYSGFRLSNEGNDLVEYSMVDTIRYTPPDHNTGMSFRGGDGVRITRNWIEGSSSSAVSLYPDQAPITDMTAEENLFDGGTYSIIGGDGKEYGPDSNYIRFLNNKLTYNYTYGPRQQFSETATGNQWLGNVHLEDGTLAGSEVNNAPAPSSSPSPSGTVLSDTAIQWSWTSVSDATGYKVSLDGGAFFDVGDVLLYEDTGLSAEQTRTFKVLAYNESGDGPESATISRTTDAAPVVPADWQTAWDSNNQVTIDNWYAANTGFEAYYDTGLGRTLQASDLTEVGTFTTSSDGQVVEKLIFTGQVNIEHDDVTIRGCRFDQAGASGSAVIDQPVGQRFTIEYCTFRGVTTGDDNRSLYVNGPNEFTVRFCQWSRDEKVGSAAMRFEQAQGQGEGIKVEYCYISGVGGGGTSRATAISQRCDTAPHNNVSIHRCNIRGRGSACITMYNRSFSSTPDAIMSNIHWSECLFNTLDRDYADVESKWYNKELGTVYATRFGQDTTDGQETLPVEDCSVVDCKWGRWSYPPTGSSAPFLRDWPSEKGNIWTGNRFLTPGVGGIREAPEDFNLGNREDWFWDATNQTWAYPE